MNKQTLGKFDQNASLKKGIVVCLLTAALLVSMVGIGIANPSIRWDLDNDGVMYRPDAHSESGNITITNGNSYVWRADQVAQCDVYFPVEQWQGRLTTNEDLAGKYTVDIGYSDANGDNFVSNGVTGSQTWYNAGMGASNFAIGTTTGANGFTVPQGKYLALKVANTGKSPSFTVETDGTSYVIWPPHSDYPVPELPTIILMSTGLLALAGFVLYSRSRRMNGKAQ